MPNAYTFTLIDDLDLISSSIEDQITECAEYVIDLIGRYLDWQGTLDFAVEIRPASELTWSDADGLLPSIVQIGWNGSGWVNQTLAECLTGFDPDPTRADAGCTIYLAADGTIRNYGDPVWFDPNPQFEVDPSVPAGTHDFVGIYTHEIFHSLGFNAVTIDWLDRLVIEGGLSFFDGPNTVALYGARLPFAPNSDHYGFSEDPTISIDRGLMYEFGNYERNRLDIGRIDLAVLADLGHRIKTYDGLPLFEMLDDEGDLTGSSGDDDLYGDYHANVLDGRGGNDLLDGGSGNDTMTGRDGDDRLVANGGSDSAQGAAGSDTLVVDYATSAGNVSAGSGPSLDAGGYAGSYQDGLGRSVTYSGIEQFDITTGSGIDLIEGGIGNDRLDGGAGADEMRGGSGDDSYFVDNAGDAIVDDGGVDTISSRIDLVLAAGLEHLRLLGDAPIDGTGNDADNHLTGNGADNQLDGGGGADTMAGGLGSDTYIVDVLNETVVEAASAGIDLVVSSMPYVLPDNVENLTLTGAAQNGYGNALDNVITGSGQHHNLYGLDGNDTLLGGNLSDSVQGGDGDDWLEGGDGPDYMMGGPGADTMMGGDGWDYYYVDDPGDLVIELAPHIFDEVNSSISFTLPDNLRVLNLTGTSAINGTGNALPNRIHGNDGDNVIDGGEGLDDMRGGQGNDTYVVDAPADYIVEEADSGIDTVRSTSGFTLPDNVEDLILIGENLSGTGNALDNSLTGTAGLDFLDGLGGADRMAGGAGNDVYRVDNAGDLVIEQAGAGTDEAYSSITYTLGANVERMTLTGDAAIDGTGNELDNDLQGNEAANLLDGGAGNDRIDGGFGNDTLAGGVGDDVFIVDQAGDLVIEAAGEGIDRVEAPVSFILGANVENLTLTGEGAIDAIGNDLANILTGNGSANILDGDLGADTMAGGLGDDTYVVDAAGDVVTEASGGGGDTVQASITFALGTEVENLTLTGAAAINGTGNALANILTGNAAANILNGLGGADTMSGALGDDTYVVDNPGDVAAEAASAGTDTVVSSTTFALGTHIENLTLTGAAAINGTGNTLANLLVGNSAANILDGAAGADTMQGGGGNDTYVVDNTGDVVSEAAAAGTDLVQSSATHMLGANVENLTLIGTAAINGTGNTLANLLVGNSAANILDGGAGADTMNGGLGNDSYIVDLAGDVVIEAAGAGTDLVRSSLGHALAANVENLILTGTSSVNGTGNALANNLTGNGSANILDGGAGGDTMTGGLGNDTYVVDNALDKAIETSASGGTDLVRSSISFTLGANLEKLTITGTAAINGAGNTLANTLVGNDAANTLNGGAGNDSMQGGLGDDTYVVDSAGDKAVETSAAGGTDRVQSSVTFTLGANVENLILTGTAAINGNGNTLANMLTGNAAANVLDGKAGADIMQGGLGNDTYVVDDAGDLVSDTSAAGGIDLVKSSVSFTLGLNIENLTLTGTGAIDATGNSLANILLGNSGANILDGKGGADRMTGGAGDDTFIIDHAGDLAVETNIAHGVDTVRSTLSYTLGANIENLVLTGPGAIDGTGSSANNILTGNGAANILKGMLGNDTLQGGGGTDTLYGGTGNDVLEGGTGADAFIFDSALNAASNLDHLLDFAHGSDKIHLENAIFKGLAAGALNANAFVVGTAAADASDRIIYDAATGNLYYDSDGSGANAQVQFATLDNMPANLSASDFLVF